ncbi:MAG TPA: hypothetical protein VHS80_15340 [Chthoniobacterales bacterium]|nr:hypothetical protein [Chthoniobacterales bacterium]
MSDKLVAATAWVTSFLRPPASAAVYFTNYQLPIYRLPITDYRSPITDHRLLITDY